MIKQACLPIAALGALTVVFAPLNAPAQEPSGGWPNISVKGLLDARLAFTGNARGWEDRGFGKTRYGGDTAGGSRTVARIAEASLVVQSMLTWDLTAVAHLTANSRQRHAVEPVEAFLSYKPAPTSSMSYRVKAGAFFPAISFENTGLAWTSPYTISSAAINTWIGEEIRNIGAEGTLVLHGEETEATLSAGLFGFNDPVGSLLAWRGWAIHDRESGLFDRLPLAPLSNFGASGSAPGQAGAVDPIEELDNRIGYYVAAGVTDNDGLRLRLFLYNNNADDLSFDGSQYAWNTRFGAVSGAWAFDDGWEVVTQAMAGNTTMATFPKFSVVDNDFASAFVLASREWNRHRLSARLEVFEIEDRDMTLDDPNGEHGQALTLAYVFRPNGRQRLTLELLHVASNRQRRADFGLPVRARETLAQVSYRLFFSTD
ncbi:MAG: hypothetical protein SFV19_08765 [Rhodospirillaceae bacterium]|nr:hypothetical protein [Rhodospirillaceae bacterium]